MLDDYQQQLELLQFEKEKDSIDLMNQSISTLTDLLCNRPVLKDEVQASSVHNLKNMPIGRLKIRKEEVKTQLDIELEKLSEEVFNFSNLFGGGDDTVVYQASDFGSNLVENIETSYVSENYKTRSKLSKNLLRLKT